MKEIKAIRVGGIFDKPDKKNEAGSIYDINGLSPALTTNGGGYHEPLIIIYEQDKTEISDRNRKEEK